MAQFLEGKKTCPQETNRKNEPPVAIKHKLLSSWNHELKTEDQSVGATIHVESILLSQQFGLLVMVQSDATATDRGTQTRACVTEKVT